MNEMSDHSNPATPLISKSVIKTLAVQNSETEDYSKHACVRCGKEGFCDEVCPEQTEDDKIREAFEKEDLSSFMIRDRPVQNRNEKVRLFRGYNLCYKSRQQEIEELKKENLALKKTIEANEICNMDCIKHENHRVEKLHTAIEEEMSHVNGLVHDNLKKHKEIEELKCCGNCDNDNSNTNLEGVCYECYKLSNWTIKESE